MAKEAAMGAKRVVAAVALAALTAAASAAATPWAVARWAAARSENARVAGEATGECEAKVKDLAMAAEEMVAEVVFGTKATMLHRTRTRSMQRLDQVQRAAHTRSRSRSQR